MHTSTLGYGMKKPGDERIARPYTPAPLGPVPADTSTAYIVLSIAEVLLAGVFAAIPLFWSIQYRRAARKDPRTPIRATAKSMLIFVAVVGGLVNVLATFLWLISQAP